MITEDRRLTIAKKPTRRFHCHKQLSGIYKSMHDCTSYYFITISSSYSDRRHCALQSHRAYTHNCKTYGTWEYESSMVITHRGHSTKLH